MQAVFSWNILLMLQLKAIYSGKAQNDNMPVEFAKDESFYTPLEWFQYQVSYVVIGQAITNKEQKHSK